MSPRFLVLFIGCGYWKASRSWSSVSDVLFWWLVRAVVLYWERLSNHGTLYNSYCYYTVPIIQGSMVEQLASNSRCHLRSLDTQHSLTLPLNDLQHVFLRSYAILSATTQFTTYAQNVHHRPKSTLGGYTLIVCRNFIIVEDNWIKICSLA